MTAWIAYAFQGPEDKVQDALDELREAPNGADLIRPQEGQPPLPPVLAIPGHALFGFALQAGAQPPATPPGCFPVDPRLAAAALQIGPPQDV